MVDQSITGFLNNPGGWALQGVWDWGTLLVGSREEKVKALSGYIPIGAQAFGLFTGQPSLSSEQYKTNTMQIIGQQKATQPGAKEFWEKKTVLTTDIEAPQFPDLTGILKWALIGVIGIIVLIILLRRSD